MLTERDRSRGLWGRSQFVRLGASTLRITTETFDGVEDERAPTANCLVGHALLVLTHQVEGDDFDLTKTSKRIDWAGVPSTEVTFDIWPLHVDTDAVWAGAWPKLSDTLRRLAGPMGSVVEGRSGRWPALYFEYGLPSRHAGADVVTFRPKTYPRLALLLRSTSRT